MKQHILPALRLTLACIVLFMVIYPLAIWAVAQAAPNKGEGETITLKNKTVGYALEGQNFTQDKYFNGRPSAAGYNAAGSSGSNKGPSNPDYLKQVQASIDSFLVHNPSVKKEDIPSDLVTASGSGLDPDITPQGALIQVARIAKARNIQPATLTALINNHIEKSILGPKEKINVLKLNVALDQLK